MIRTAQETGVFNLIGAIGNADEGHARSTGGFIEVISAK
jgi:hypothetical protein